MIIGGGGHGLAPACYLAKEQGTIIQDLQRRKRHAYFPFSVHLERALAIDFAGPIYTLGFVFIECQ